MEGRKESFEIQKIFFLFTERQTFILFEENFSPHLLPIHTSFMCPTNNFKKKPLSQQFYPRSSPRNKERKDIRKPQKVMMMMKKLAIEE